MLWDGRPCATKCEQCEYGKAYVEGVRGFEHLTEGEHVVVSLCFPTAALLFRSHRFRRALHRVVAAFWLCLGFRFCASLPALS